MCSFSRQISHHQGLALITAGCNVVMTDARLFITAGDTQQQKHGSSSEERGRSYRHKRKLKLWIHTMFMDVLTLYTYKIFPNKSE